MVAVSRVGGSHITPAGPLGTWRVFSALQGHTGMELCFTGTVIGLFLWLPSWLLLRCVLKTRGSIVGVLAVWAVPALIIPPADGDIFNYVEQGWVVLHGGNPTTMPAGSMPGPYSAWSGFWSGTTVGYPPLALALQAFCVILSCGRPWAALLAIRVVNMLSIGLVIAFLPAIAKHLGHDATAATWFVALNPFLLTLGVIDAHNDLPALAVATAGTALLWRHGGRWAGIMILVLAGLIKPTALLTVILYTWPWTSSLLKERAGTKGAGHSMIPRIVPLIISGSAVAALLILTVLISKLTWLGDAWTHPTGSPSWASNSLWCFPISYILHHVTPVPLSPRAEHAASFTLVLLVLVAIALNGRFKNDPGSMLALTVFTLCTLGPASRSWYLLPLICGIAVSNLSWRTRVESLIIPFMCNIVPESSRWVLRWESGEVFGWMMGACAVAWIVTLRHVEHPLGTNRRAVEAPRHQIDPALR